MKLFRHISVIVIALMSFFAPLSALSAPVTDDDVDIYKASIVSYLRQEGYLPKLDSDGDIQFKHDGDTYWIQASPYDDGYYVSVMTQTSIKGESLTKARKAMDETVGSLKYVRMYTISNGNTMNIVYNWYCVTVNDFKRMFGNALDVVSTADNRFIKKMVSE